MIHPSPDLDRAARDAAGEILDEYAGSATLRAMLVIAYLRGNVAGMREASAVIERTKPAEVAA